MRRERLCDIVLPLAVVLLVLLPAWVDLRNFSAHESGWTFWLLVAAIPVVIGLAIYAGIMRRWMRTMALIVALALCALFISVESKAMYCVDCDKIPPHLNAAENWILTASGWHRAHPDAFQGWTEIYENQESEALS